MLGTAAANGPGLSQAHIWEWLRLRVGALYSEPWILDSTGECKYMTVWSSFRPSDLTFAWSQVRGYADLRLRCYAFVSVLASVLSRHRPSC